MSATVAEICRYPVKGLSPEVLEEAALEPGRGLAHDRCFAIAHGSDRSQLFSLLSDERLAQLRVRYEEAGKILTILRAGKPVVRAQVEAPHGRLVIDQFLAGFLSGKARGAPRLMTDSEAAFADMGPGVISLVNLASVADLERVMRVPVHRHRFRANIYLEGLDAWAENDWIGREVTIGTARVKIVELIERCGATNVDPERALRDLNIPLALQRGFRHIALGVYGEVLSAGRLRPGDRLQAPA